MYGATMEESDDDQSESGRSSIPKSRPGSAPLSINTTKRSNSASIQKLNLLQSPKVNGGGKTQFSQADEDVPFFQLGGEGLTKPRHIRGPVLNLGELVVEGATLPQYDPSNLHEEPHGVFESFFDLTEPRLRVIFTALESSTTGKREGVADFQNLRRGLADAGVKIDDEEGFARLVAEVDQDLDGGLTFSEFEAVVQSLKMAYLLRTLTPEEAEESCGPTNNPKIRVMDYSVARVSNRSPRGTDLSAFLYSPRSDWATTRWVDVTSPCPFVIKGLAIKYRLHPLALEDALHAEFDQSAKIDRYSNHLFVVFPGMALEENSDDLVFGEYSQSNNNEQLERGRYWRRKESRLRHLHRFQSSGGLSQEKEPLLPPSTTPLNAPPNLTKLGQRKSNVVLETLGNEKDDAAAILASFPGVIHYNVCLFLNRPNFDTLISIVDKSAGGVIFRRVRNELQVAYSRLRSQNALFLMYTVLDVLVDQYSPIMDSFETHINALRMEVRENAARRGILFDAQTDTDFLARYHDVLHELTKAKRRISPAIRVLRHLTQLDEFDAECRVYLRDVLDHAEDVIERLESMMDDCRSLKAEQQHSIDTKLTKSMAALTVVGIIFLPGQFLTGVFGMNFKSMPGIENRYGYLYFWIAAILSWVGMWLIFRRYRVV